MVKKKRKIYAFNPGGIQGFDISDDELGKFAGVGLNKRKKKKKASTKKKRSKSKTKKKKRLRDNTKV